MTRGWEKNNWKKDGGWGGGKALALAGFEPGSSVTQANWMTTSPRRQGNREIHMYSFRHSCSTEVDRDSVSEDTCDSYKLICRPSCLSRIFWLNLPVLQTGDIAIWEFVFDMQSDKLDVPVYFSHSWHWELECRSVLLNFMYANVLKEHFCFTVKCILYRQKKCRKNST
jgi:hypothetical protein